MGTTSRPCTKIASLLADYLEHRLPPEVHEDLERHLGSCDVCLRQLRTYRSTVSLLRSLTDDELPPELRLRLRAFMDHRHCGHN